MLPKMHPSDWDDPPVGHHLTSPHRGDLWGVLECFGRELQKCECFADQVSLLLHMIARGTRAEVVFACHASGSAPVEVVGSRSVSPAWCRELADHLLGEVPPGQGQLLRSPLAFPPDGDGAAPRSAALVRLSKTRELWIIALMFDADQAFRLSDLKWMGL